MKSGLLVSGCISYLLLDNEVPPNSLAYGNYYLLSPIFRGSGICRILLWVILSSVSHESSVTMLAKHVMF